MNESIVTTLPMYDTVTGLAVSDMSSSNKLVTAWQYVGVGRKVSLTASWPATGAPVGTIYVEASNDPMATGGATAAGISVVGDAIDITTFTPTPVQPAGTAGRMPLAFESPGAFVRFTYQRTSGGAGAALVVNFHVQG